MRLLTPQMVKRLEVFCLSFAFAMVASPSGRRFLAAHSVWDDAVIAAYVAYRAADKPNPTLPGAPGSPSNQ